MSVCCCFNPGSVDEEVDGESDNIPYEDHHHHDGHQHVRHERHLALEALGATVSKRLSPWRGSQNSQFDCGCTGKKFNLKIGMKKDQTRAPKNVQCCQRVDKKATKFKQK